MAVPTPTLATTVATRTRNKKEVGGVCERVVETAAGAAVEAVVEAVEAVAVMTVQEGATYGGKSFERPRERESEICLHGLHGLWLHGLFGIVRIRV